MFSYKVSDSFKKGHANSVLFTSFQTWIFSFTKDRHHPGFVNSAFWEIIFYFIL